MSLTPSEIPAVAQTIAGYYLASLQQDQVVPLPRGAWNQAEHHWSLWKSEAFQALDFGPIPARTRLETSVQDLIAELQTWLSSPPLLRSVDGESLSQQLADELQALLREFEAVDWDQATLTLFVQTPEIVLEEIDLGPFEICLKFSPRDNLPSYEVTAINPTYGGGRTDHPHPHIQDTRLCEGDGKTAIAASLQAGRLSDFFLIVRQILQTYNDASAYVSLHDWNGEACHACAAVVDEDDLSHCGHCSAMLCSTCGSCCEQCRDILCDECAHRCAFCLRIYCPQCAGDCTGCHQPHLCQECLDDQNHCPRCRTSAADGTEPADESEPAEHADSDPQEDPGTADSSDGDCLAEELDDFLPRSTEEIGFAPHISLDAPSPENPSPENPPPETPVHP